MVIVGPLLMPAFALAAARKSACPSLSDLALGFVAVAFAGTARAAAAKTDAWLAYATIASLVVGLQTAVAVSLDTAMPLEKLQQAIASMDEQHALTRVSDIHDLNQQILERSANVTQWLISTVVGIIFIVISFELIRREP